QGHADHGVPHELESGHVALRAVRDLVNEQHRVIQPEDGDGKPGAAHPAGAGCASGERGPSDRGADEHVAPVDGGRRLEPLDWNRANGFVDGALRWRLAARGQRHGYALPCLPGRTIVLKSVMFESRMKRTRSVDHDEYECRVSSNSGAMRRTFGSRDHGMVTMSWCSL